MSLRHQGCVSNYGVQFLVQFCSFLHDRPWMSPWTKSISNELDITIHVVAPQLSGHWDIWHSHIKTPLICKSYDLDVDWVVESGVLLIQFSKCCLQNLLFSHIHMWPIEFNENMSGTYRYQRILKHCQTYIIYVWLSISPTSKMCVYVWDLCWGFTTVFLYGFEYLIDIIKKLNWSFAQQSKGMFL